MVIIPAEGRNHVVGSGYVLYRDEGCSPVIAADELSVFQPAIIAGTGKPGMAPSGKR